MKNAKHINLRNLASSVVFALMAGCAGAPTVTQTVEIPVFTSCVKLVPAKPVYEFDQLTLATSDGEKVLALARDWPRGRKYEGELEAVVEGCK